MSIRTLVGTAVVAAGIVAATPAAAITTLTSVGTTTLASPTFNRPLTLTSLSGVGTAVHYNLQPFVVETAGNYSLLMTSGNTFDTFLALYSGSFNPASPLTNLVQINDDFGGVVAAGSGFTIGLTTGTTYFAVLTAFSNTGVGTYTFSIAPASVVPEPASWALLIGGFGGIGAAMRRRATVRTKVAFA